MSAAIAWAALGVAVLALIVAICAVVAAHEAQLEVDMLSSRTPHLTSDGEWLLPHIERTGKIASFPVFMKPHVQVVRNEDGTVTFWDRRDNESSPPLGGMAVPKKPEWIG